MPPTKEELVKNYVYDPANVIRISRRKAKHSLAIIDPDPAWPAKFHAVKVRIQQALGSKALCVSHVGSTSIPGLAAKDVIDVDLTVADARRENDYVPALEAAGFQWLSHEPAWHHHHFFVCYEPMTNLHVFSEGCPELVRHLMFREYISSHDEERALYAAAKREASAAATGAGETGMQYNLRKEATIRAILQRMWREAGFVE
ncbi:hypothetical protein E4U53_003596 [Claviceps sorghi]|nr:hypothetical protein E4U53_003596 [Claviceps sorghi]